MTVNVAYILVTFMQPALNSQLKLALSLTLQLNMYNSFYILSFAN